MSYVEVWVRSDRYRGVEALSYSSGEALTVGSIVQVPMRTEHVVGFVSGIVPKPSFPTKPIDKTLPLKPLPKENVYLAEWLLKFYASPVGVITSLLLPAHITIREPASQPISVASGEPALPILTEGQREALGSIVKPDTYTLHGRTGSGKTRLYIELVKRQLSAGKSSIILSPEIGLTSQLAQEFSAVFGPAKIVILHSQLSIKERDIRWQSILESDQPLIVIGPRSALFSPINKLGLIVVDESHDQAYKQEQPPYYHAIRVASQLRKLHGATLVLGSATPSIGDYYLASTKAKPIIRLSQLAKATPEEREVTIVDLKDRSQFVRSAYLSEALIRSVQQSLMNGEQALFYLNRRGTARITLCSQCGWQARCPHCDLPLTYHGDAFRLRCHTCGFSQPIITVCPECGNPGLAFRSFGTKAIVTETERLFPDARILRFDTDNTAGERLEWRYKDILSGKVDILIGTQILAKGLDLPRLSTLGVLLADTSLYLPDYTAQERTYQMLTQVIGRIGRGHIQGRAVIQTYYPDSELLHASLADDWEQFYNIEISERRQYAFPPFYQLLKLSTRRSSAAAAERTMQAFKHSLETSGLPLIIDGPAPAFHEKVQGKFQWQLVLKARERGILLTALKQVPKGWSYDLDPVDLL